MIMSKIELYQGDCLIESDKIESGSVDLILTDLPYGTITNAPKNWTVSNESSHKWDFAIEPKKVFDIANRILRKNGKIILFSQEPYTSRLTTEAISNIPFCYRMMWEKNDFANALLCNKAPVSYFEDILVFSKNNPIHDCEFIHPLRLYFKLVMGYIGLNKKQVVGKIGQRADHVFRTESSQFGLCTEQTYNELIKVFNIDKMNGFKEFSELLEIDKPFKATFNLWQGNKYKSNILKYKKDYNGFHQTQKPILLLEDLIKTFSNENDLVVDLTMGSGSTGVASVNCGRKFIGIELDEKYFKIAKERINNQLL